jgi:hypothetical protein
VAHELLVRLPAVARATGEANRTRDALSAVDPRWIMVVIGGIGTVAQGLAAWWWFKVSSHELSVRMRKVRGRLQGELNERNALWPTDRGDFDTPPLVSTQ